MSTYLNLIAKNYYSCFLCVWKVADALISTRCPWPTANWLDGSEAHWGTRGSRSNHASVRPDSAEYYRLLMHRSHQIISVIPSLHLDLHPIHKVCTNLTRITNRSLFNGGIISCSCFYLILRSVLRESK